MITIKMMSWDPQVRTESNTLQGQNLFKHAVTSKNSD